MIVSNPISVDLYVTGDIYDITLGVDIKFTKIIGVKKFSFFFGYHN